MLDDLEPTGPEDLAPVSNSPPRCFATCRRTRSSPTSCCPKRGPVLRCAKPTIGGTGSTERSW